MKPDQPPPLRPMPPPALPPINAATLLRALCKRARPHATAVVPDTLFVLERIDVEHVRRYRRALGFGAVETAPVTVPLTWWYLPAQRAQVATLLQSASPFRLAGSVHTANAIESFGSPRFDAPILLATRVEVRPPAASGAIVADLETTARQHGTPVFVCRSSYLLVRGKRGGGPKPGAPGAPSAPSATEPPVPAIDGWPLAPDAGRAYAALSGDWNPIHLWGWSARLFGLPRPIIHGMHTLARTCAALERAGGRPVALLDGRFKSPAQLGRALTLGADLDRGRFAVAAGERTIVDGVFRYD